MGGRAEKFHPCEAMVSWGRCCGFVVVAFMVIFGRMAVANNIATGLLFRDLDCD